MTDFVVDKYFCNHHDKELDKKVLQPFIQIARIPGNKVRSKFFQALNIWMNVAEDKLRQIEFILDTAHNFSLIIDDIQDKSKQRRGFPTAHNITYDIFRTANSYKYLYNVILEKVLEMKNHKATEIYLQKITELYMGQGMEIYWRDNFLCPTLEEYKLMCIHKTGNLFLLGIELMQLFSDVKRDFTKFGRALGVFFQIRDDFMNLCSDEYFNKKAFCEDISEGKFSFPIIHAIQTRPGDKRVINILKQKPQDFTTKKYCLSLLEEFGSLDYTEQVLIKLKKELIEELNDLPNNQTILHIFNDILHFEKTSFIQKNINNVFDLILLIIVFIFIYIRWCDFLIYSLFTIKNIL